MFPSFFPLLLEPWLCLFDLALPLTWFYVESWDGLGMEVLHGIMGWFGLGGTWFVQSPLPQGLVDVEENPSFCGRSPCPWL